MARQSRIAARHGSRTQNSGGLTGNEGRSRAARRKIPSHPLCSVIPESEPTIDSQSKDPLLMHRQFIKLCLSPSIYLFATSLPQFFNFLAIFRLTFLEGSNPYFQFSIQADFIPLILVCPSIRLLWLKSLGLEHLIDPIKSHIRIFSIPNV